MTFIDLNWPFPHYCYQEWRKLDTEVMMVTLNYSVNFFKFIGLEAHTVPNFHQFHLGNVIRSKIISLGIRKRRDYKMYRQSRGRRKIFHCIYTLVIQVQHRCIQAATSNIPWSINWDNLFSIQQVQLPNVKVFFNHCALINC